MAKLTAPCPHCGSPTQSYSIYGFWGVRCEAGCNSLHPSREKAVDAWNARADTAEAQIADLKRALDTARHDALEEAAKVAERHDLMPCGHAPGWDEDQKLHYDCGQVDACSSVAAAIRSLSASPLSQGGQQ